MQDSEGETEVPVQSTTGGVVVKCHSKLQAELEGMSEVCCLLSEV